MSRPQRWILRWKLATGGGGLRRWRVPVLVRVAAALIATFALWQLVGKLFAICTLQRKFLEGSTALVAACVLLYVTHWMFRKAHVGDRVAEIRRRTSAVSGSGEIATMFGGLMVFGLAFLVVFREGFETVLFYEALPADAPKLPVLAGLVAGAALAAMVAYLMLGLEARLPVAAFFNLTGGLLAFLTIILVGNGVRGLQTAALVSATSCFMVSRPGLASALPWPLSRRRSTVRAALRRRVTATVCHPASGSEIPRSTCILTFPERDLWLMRLSIVSWQTGWRRDLTAMFHKISYASFGYRRVHSIFK